jgi:3-hydroxyacyl-CoA dehydrogenase
MIVVSPEAQALRHAFLAERAAAHVSFGRNEGKRSASERVFTEVPLKIEVVGVVGSGVMGSGIAASLLMGGYAVVMCDVNTAALVKAKQSIFAIISSAVKRGRIKSSSEAKRMQSKLSTSAEFSRCINL